MFLWLQHVMRDRIWWEWKVSNLRLGPHCSRVFAHLLEIWSLTGDAKRGWQHEASSRIERRHREFLLSRLSENEQARSQSGPLAGAALLATPSHAATRIGLTCSVCSCCAGLRLPLPHVSRTCRCPLDSCGHHCTRHGFGLLRGRLPCETQSSPSCWRPTKLLIRTNTFGVIIGQHLPQFALRRSPFHHNVPQLVWSWICILTVLYSARPPLETWGERRFGGGGGVRKKCHVRQFGGGLSPDPPPNR